MIRMIKFVGKRALVRDTVTGSGLEWRNGETLPVPEAIAVRLLKHSDVWAENLEVAPEPVPVTVAPVTELQALVPLEVTDLGKQWEEDPMDEIIVTVPPLNLDEMTSNEICRWASLTMNRHLDSRLPAASLAKQVRAELLVASRG